MQVGGLLSDTLYAGRKLLSYILYAGRGLLSDTLYAGRGLLSDTLYAGMFFLFCFIGVNANVESRKKKQISI